MIEIIDDDSLYDFVDLIKIDDHAFGRTVALQRPVDCDLENVRMPVKARAFARMMRENMRRLEAEGLTNLHGYGVYTLIPPRYITSGLTGTKTFLVFGSTETEVASNRFVNVLTINFILLPSTIPSTGVGRPAPVMPVDHQSKHAQ